MTARRKLAVMLCILAFQAAWSVPAVVYLHFPIAPIAASTGLALFVVAVLF